MRTIFFDLGAFQRLVFEEAVGDQFEFVAVGVDDVTVPVAWSI